jgi:hypothetical protein
MYYTSVPPNIHPFHISACFITLLRKRKGKGKGKGKIGIFEFLHLYLLLLLLLLLLLFTLLFLSESREYTDNILVYLHGTFFFDLFVYYTRD